MNLSAIDRDMLIRTVIGEAAHEPLKGQAGVVSVILNRLASGKHGNDVQDVVFAKHQFEPWDTRRSELLGYKPESETYQRAAGVVDAVLADQIKDPTDGATHFLNAATVRARRGGSLPDWAQGDGQEIGRHTFYAPEGKITRVADTGGAAPVTDAAVLQAFGGGTPDTAAAPTEVPPAAGPSPVTDPAILQQFGATPTGATPTPPIAGGTPGNPATLAIPILSGKEIGMGGAFVQGFASDQQEGLRALAQSLYPNEPIEKSLARFGQDGGVLYHTADDGKRYRVNPEGWSIQDVLNQVAGSVGKAIPATAGAAVGMATAPAAMAGPGGLAASLAATGSAAAGGEYVREKIGDYMMGDASTGEVSPWQVAGEAGSALAGQGAGATMGKIATRGAVRDIARYDAADTAKAYADAAAQGISLTPAEATGIASLKAQQKRLLNTMETADTMAEFMTRRDTEVRTAWNGFMDSVSTAQDAEKIGKLARGTADSIFTDMRTALSAKAKPYYDAFYAQPVPLTGTLREFMQRPVMKDAFKGAAALAENDGQKFNPAQPSARDWDYVKRSLDDILNSKAAMNERTGGRNQYGYVVNNLRRDLLHELDGINPDYATARSIYSTGAEDVTGAMQSALKILSDTKDTQVLAAARHVFDPKTRSPDMIVKLRGALEGKDPDAWQALKRMYIQDVSTDALRMTEQGGVLNPAGKIHKAFMDDRLQANLKAAMTPDEWKNMSDLLVVFKRASSVPALRSDTAFNLWAKDAERAQAEGWFSKYVLKQINPAQAARNVAEWRTTRRMDRNAARMAEIVTSNDPDAIATMRELRRLSPWDKRWMIVFGHLIGQGGAAAAGEMIPQPDFQQGGAVGGGSY